MSYCVKCGVELDEGAERCPLCGTPAWKPDETEPRYFPTKPAEVPRASRRAAAALLTAMLASVSLCCGLLNLAVFNYCTYCHILSFLTFLCGKVYGISVCFHHLCGKHLFFGCLFFKRCIQGSKIDSSGCSALLFIRFLSGILLPLP